MAKIGKFEDLEVWQIAKSIAVEVYHISDLEPIKSDFGLKDQMRRAAMSLSDNVAEGFEYNNNPDFIRFLVYAKGSSGELRNKLIILRESGKLDQVNFDSLYSKSIDFSAKIKRFINYLKSFEKGKRLNSNAIK
ncbi:four helix bundle protein [Pedobacter sp. ASV28]|uniref:four helix bundle protein n=1 Tax=Pedobacter sp. ASV28 TaxID=2795123 RepID=UPI0018EA55BD|nr:four helix bundle protein [Pedobacter sp. ASV28]